MPTPSDYSDFRMSKDNSAERGQGKQGVSGDYGQTANAPTTDVPEGSYPNLWGHGFDESNPQFSSDKASTPDAMAAETASSQNAFADLQQFLNNSPYTAGSRTCNEQQERWKSAHDAAPGPGDGETGPA